MCGRNPFTSDEESLLVKYIATYNPQTNGRAGNALYQKLVENADGKWKWSKTHTWQSWRAQYYKNQDYYDRRIRKYQKKHGISDEKPLKGLTRLKRAREDIESMSDEEEDVEAARPPKKQKTSKVKEEKGVMNGPKTLHQGRNERREEDKEDKRARYTERQEEEEDSSASDSESETAQRSGPVGSDDYAGALSLDSEKDEDAARSEVQDGESDKERSEAGVDQQVVVSNEADASNPDLSHILRTTTNVPDYEPLYPDIQTLPTPHLHANASSEPKSSIPGSFNGTFHLNQKPQGRSSPNPQPKATSSKVQLSPAHTPSPPSATKDRRKRLTEKEEENIFGTPLRTPSPLQSDASRTKHRLPRLIEGPFGTSFAGPRKSAIHDTDSSDEEKAKASWPPVRKKRTSVVNGKGKEKEVSKDSSDRNLHDNAGKSGGAPNGKAVVAPDPANDPANVRPVVRRPVQVNAQASSSRTLLSPAPEPTPAAGGTRLGKPSGRLMVNRKKMKSLSSREEEDQNPSSELTNQHPDKQLKSTSSLNQELGKIQATSVSDLTRTTSAPGPLPVRKSSSLRHETKLVEFPMPRESWTPGNPFRSHRPPAVSNSRPREKAPSLNLFDRRHTIGGASEYPLPARRIDLRAEISKRLRPRLSLPVHSRTHSTARTYSHSTPNSHHSSVGTTISTRTGTSAKTIGSNASSTTAHRRASLLPLPIADEDRAKIEYLGMSTAIAMIAENFGFREEAVWRMWKFFKNISKIEEFCIRYKKKSESTEDAVLEEMEKDGWDMKSLFGEDPEESQHQPEPHLPLQPEPLFDREGHDNSSPARPRSAKKRNLEVKPLHVEDDTLSEYTPPFTSRAGQYVRLVKQGRKEEALLREGRRASGAGKLFGRARSMSMGDATPQSQAFEAVVQGAGAQTTEEFQPETDSESESETEAEEDLEDEREMQPKEATRDERKMQPEEDVEEATEDEVEMQLEENGSASAPEQPSAEDEESLADGLQDSIPWTEDDEEAFLSANKGNADALRQIEQRTDMDFMLCWTATRLAEFRDRFVGARSPREPDKL